MQRNKYTYKNTKSALHLEHLKKIKRQEFEICTMQFKLKVKVGKHNSKNIPYLNLPLF